MKRAAIVTLTVAGAAVTAPSAAHAVGATVTGDDGRPLPLGRAAPVTIRNMDVRAVATVASREAVSWQTHVLGPSGQPASTTSPCLRNQTTQRWTNLPEYEGNGLYGVVVVLFSDRACAQPQGLARLDYKVEASTELIAPQGALLTRPPNQLGSITHRLALIRNPGARQYEVRFAQGGVVGADGALSGPSSVGFANAVAGTADLRFDRPGLYTVVARASADRAFSPWSAPLQVRAVAPFDLERATFTDRRGPSYRVRGVVREKAARGRVTLALARGTRGRFRTVGRARIRRDGSFARRFRVRRHGSYRLRFSYRGSELVARGSSTLRVRITRRLR